MLVLPLFVSLSAFAQSNTNQLALTRTEVKAQLATLEKAGYKPEADRANYPEGIQKANAQLNQISN